MQCTELRSLQYIETDGLERMQRLVRGCWRSRGRMGGEEGVAPRGYVPVLVGAAAAEEEEEEEEGLQRFLMSVEAFKHACFVSLLEMAAGEFGYQQKGVLRIPCAPEHFRRVLEMAIKERERVREAVSKPVE
ncbi:hypothetical protein GW17_00010668 [Ensete ventricosum]|nr:hypothetical protein GW17_00010668 [Ensete ventricosum]